MSAKAGCKTMARQYRKFPYEKVAKLWGQGKTIAQIGHAIKRIDKDSATGVEHTNRHAFLCPCWQLQTRFARHRSAYKLMPDIGALIFHISSDAKKQGADPIAFTKLLYRLPVPRVNKFERGKKLRQAV